MDKRLHLYFPLKRWLGISKNYGVITLTFIAAKIYNALLLNCIESENEKILRKNQNGFRRNLSKTFELLTIRWILGVRAKDLETILLFVNFSKAFNFINRGKQILLAYGLPKETVAAIMIKTRSKSSLSGWRRRYLWHCCWCAARDTLAL